MEKRRFIGDRIAGEKYGILNIHGNFRRMMDANVFAEKINGKVSGYLYGKYKRGWVVYTTS